MIKVYNQVLISASTKHEAILISQKLVARKLIAGSYISSGDSLYWWNKRVVRKKYFNISGFTLKDKKKEIVRVIKQFHSDKCPIIAFISIDGNVEFLRWIKENVA